MSSKSHLETVLESYAVKYAKQRYNFLAFKLNNRASDGWPDRLFITSNGNHFYIEFKRSGEKPRPLQAVRIANLLAHNVHVYVVDNKEEIFNVFDYEAGRVDSPPLSRASRENYDPARGCWIVDGSGSGED